MMETIMLIGETLQTKSYNANGQAVQMILNNTEGDGTVYALPMIMGNT